MDEMEDIEVPIKAGSIRRISVENFMCHSSLTIELGDRVNFITGQNGSTFVRPFDTLIPTFIRRLLSSFFAGDSKIPPCGMDRPVNLVVCFGYSVSGRRFTADHSHQ